MAGEAEAAWQQLQDSGTEQLCFRALQQRELLAAGERLEGMRALLEQQRQREAALQERYKQLVGERDDLAAGGGQQAVAAQ